VQPFTTLPRGHSRGVEHDCHRTLPTLAGRMPGGTLLPDNPIEPAQAPASYPAGGGKNATRVRKSFTLIRHEYQSCPLLTKSGKTGMPTPVSSDTSET
jgi:hypothetical protein